MFGGVAEEKVVGSAFHVTRVGVAASLFDYKCVGPSETERCMIRCLADMATSKIQVPVLHSSIFL